MNPLGLLIALISAWFLWTLPRRLAAVPLIMGATFIPSGWEIPLGPLHFTSVKLMVVVGAMRVLARGERPGGRLGRMDYLMLFWAAWALGTSLLHKQPTAMFTTMAGIVWDYTGIYFLLRIFVRQLSDFLAVSKWVLILLIPIALEMIQEKLTQRNLFALMGGVPELVGVRHGKIRAQGPLAHPILAGTVGAVCMPLVYLFWRRRDRKTAIIGFCSTSAIVLASASSGPIMTSFAAFAAIALWKLRKRMRLMRYAAVVGIAGMHFFVMDDPFYFLLARIDLTGSSTGWHRAQLIHMAVTHFSEWWAWGTDFTRHWMPTGVYWSQDHTDITNHYIRMGVYGGIGLVLLFCAIIWAGFNRISVMLRRARNLTSEDRHAVWVLGALLFAHTLTFLTICYYDQTIVFYLFLLATITSTYYSAMRKPARTRGVSDSTDSLKSAPSSYSHLA